MATKATEVTTCQTPVAHRRMDAEIRLVEQLEFLSIEILTNKIDPVLPRLEWPFELIEGRAFGHASEWWVVGFFRKLLMVK